MNLILGEMSYHYLFAKYKIGPSISPQTPFFINIKTGKYAIITFSKKSVDRLFSNERQFQFQSLSIYFIINFCCESN